MSLKEKLSRSSNTTLAIYSAIVIFLLYTCCYGFRKPFTVALYEGQTLWGFDLKIVFVLSEIIGYAVSKFIGTAILPGVKKNQRVFYIVGLLTFSELTWIGFGALPTVWKTVSVFLSGLPLGMIWGLLFSYIEGRKISEVVNVGLSAALIVASGLVKTLGQFLMNTFSLTEYWMPFVTGAVIFPLMLLLAYLLNQIPEPSNEDKKLRTERAPMTTGERNKFFKQFFFGICMLVLLYGSLTVFRELRDSFAADLWKELNVKDTFIFTKTEYPIAFIVLALMFFTAFIPNNRLALNILYIVAGIGGFLTIGVTVLYIYGYINPVWWMILSGLGMYMGYIPFSYLIERLIASLQIVSTSVFILYLADSVGYLGTVSVYITKNFSEMNLSWNQMLIYTAIITSVIAIASTFATYKYFRRQLNVMTIVPKLGEDNKRA